MARIGEMTIVYNNWSKCQRSLAIVSVVFVTLTVLIACLHLVFHDSQAIKSELLFKQIVGSKPPDGTTIVRFGEVDRKDEGLYLVFDLKGARASISHFLLDRGFDNTQSVNTFRLVAIEHIHRTSLNLDIHQAEELVLRRVDDLYETHAFISQSHDSAIIIGEVERP